MGWVVCRTFVNYLNFKSSSQLTYQSVSNHQTRSIQLFIFSDSNFFSEKCIQNDCKWECDECDKVFEYYANLEKHVDEDVELYCHYYNNDKECPYGDECIFMHDESENCKYDIYV